MRNAEENRECAYSALAQATPCQSRWSVVMGFYAAVHYVNAYLWERLQIEPHDHAERRSFVLTLADFRPIEYEYRRLYDRAYVARYQPGHVVANADARKLLDETLEPIRAAIVPILNAQP